MKESTVVPTSLTDKIAPGFEFDEFLVGEFRPLFGADTEINVFDIFQQAAFTDLVRRKLLTLWETIPDMGDQIAPNVPVYDRTIEREIAEVAAFGVAQFRAPDATPAIFNPQMRYTQEVVSLLLIDEMQRIDEDLHLRLTSPTPAIAARAGVDLVTSATILQLRNEKRTELMRWQAFTGQNIVVSYPHSGQQVTVTYNYTSGHTPTAAVPWTDHNSSTPLDDLRAWQLQIANDLGYYGSRIHMNSSTWQTLQRSNQVRGYLTQTDRNVFLPTAADITSLLYGAQPADSQGGRVAEAPVFIVTDAGYRAEAAGYGRGMSSMTKFLADGQVMITAPYVFEGEPIADVADGMVAVAQDWNRFTWLQGMQSEIIANHDSHSYFFRQASARFVRLRRPEAFLTATVFS
jgi:hypothetical protein